MRGDTEAWHNASDNAFFVGDNIVLKFIRILKEVIEEDVNTEILWNTDSFAFLFEQRRFRT